MEARQKAFVVLIPGFASDEADTTCLPMQQHFVQTLSQLRPAVRLIVIPFQYPYHKQEYQWRGIQVLPFGGENARGIKKLLLRRQIMQQLNKLSQEFEISGLLSFWLGECALVGERFGRRKGIRHYCWLMGQDAKKGNPYARMMGDGRRIIALSEFLASGLLENYGLAVKTIPPGSRAADGQPQKRDIDILGVGSLIPLKQFEILVEAVAALKDQFPFLKVVLIGEGPERARLELLVRQYGLQEHLSFAGRIPHDEVMLAMQRTRVLVHPSSYEGYSGVCLEALNNGAHVLSFCSPTNDPIEHWHLAISKEDLKMRLLQLLQQELDHSPVIPRTMETTVEEILALYGL